MKMPTHRSGEYRYEQLRVKAALQETNLVVLIAIESFLHCLLTSTCRLLLERGTACDS